MAPQLLCLASSLKWFVFLHHGSENQGDAWKSGCDIGHHLHTASQAGTITTFNMTKAMDRGDADGEDELLVSHTISGAGFIRNIAFDQANSVLYTFGQNNGTKGTLSAFQTTGILDSTVSLLSTAETPTDPTFGLQFGASGLAVPSYLGSAFATFDVSDPSAIAEVQAEQYIITAPGPVTASQTVPHPHKAILDPWGRFLVVPDLGADLLRILSISTTEYTFAHVATIALPAGTGPRHGIFVNSTTPSSSYYF
jgi:6-phosphogluconolactonase (cycloisomerase 2 family)